MFSILCTQAAHPRDIEGAQQLFDTYKVDGSVLIYDEHQRQFYAYNAPRCNEGFLMASTFKIANTLIALETGVANADTIFGWDGKERSYKSWEADLSLAQAFRFSCVPVYQSLARAIGVERMRYYVRLLSYGDMDINADNIDTFWLEGNSRITQYQQIYFLKSLYNYDFPLSQSAMFVTRRMMLMEATPDCYLYGKTGSVMRSDANIAWLVGFVEYLGNVYYFATNLEPRSDTDMDNFFDPATRFGLTKKVLALLDMVK